MDVNASSMSQTRQLWLQRRQALSEMIGSIQSGDIAAAQKDLAQVREANSSLGISAPPPTGGRPGVQNRIDFTALLSAVQSGDLGAAQDAWHEIETNGNATVQVRPAATAMAAQIASLLSSITAADSSAMQDNAALVASQLPDAQPDSSLDLTPFSQSQTLRDPRRQLAEDMRALVTAAKSGDVTAAQAERQALLQHIQLLGSESLGPIDQTQSDARHGRIIAAGLLP